MNQKLQESIARQCAPVLMDVKPSNLLILTKEEEQAFLKMKDFYGISCLRLYAGNKKSTWLLYRRDWMEAELLWPQTQEFLQSFGYCLKQERMEETLLRFCRRFADYKEGRMDFPHEMGVFLGYPLQDVKGFIEHQGKDYLCSGYWKVYHNEEKARNTFKLYETVKNMVLQMVNAGRDFYEVGYEMIS